MKRYIFLILFFLAIAGIADAGYLTWEHYSGVIPPCTINRFIPFFADCGAVLRSKYAIMFGAPLALLGLIHYFILAFVTAAAIITNKKIWWFWILIETTIGFFASLYFMYLQFFVIGRLCYYCTLSALISFILFILALFWLEKERKMVSNSIVALIYRYIVKSILFLLDPEMVHEMMVSMGEFLGATQGKYFFDFFIKYQNKKLNQHVAGVNFESPVGLSAGFDYDAKLTQILPHIGFGFESVGTVTNMSYEGNPKPRLGRLPKSQSLMVNKGFKSIGAKGIIKKLEHLHFDFPLGISIGRTNGVKGMTQKQSVEDVVTTFQLFEKSQVKHAYYELNISCPNLYGNISFYPKNNLNELLAEIEKLKVKRPIFIKMPINNSDKEILEMLEVITKFNIKGVIFGNLQKDRKDPSLDQSEVKKFKTGNFSGKPCEVRSNELIALAYKKYGKKLVIIGCGGVFSGVDAYKKIKLGASLVELITGMIYQGPQLISQINLELEDMLKKDGFKNIKDAVGTGVLLLS